MKGDVPPREGFRDRVLFQEGNDEGSSVFRDSLSEGGAVSCCF